MIKRTMHKLAATAIASTMMLSMAPVMANAETIETYDGVMTFETPNDNWHEESNPETKITLTNGSDKVDVTEHTSDETPSPVTYAEGYAEIYQTYYTVGSTVYMLTGYATSESSVNEVRDMIESMRLTSHSYSESKEENVDEESSTIENLDHTMTVYYEDGTALTVYVLTDGRIVDANGNDLTGVADGTLKLASGDLVYEFNPTKETVDDFLGNDTSDKENGQEEGKEEENDELGVEVQQDNGEEGDELGVEVQGDE